MRSAAAASLVAVAWSSAACTSESTEGQAQQLQRVGRFGSLRAVVWLVGAARAPGEALLVDRFEVTQADWSQFSSQLEGLAAASDLGLAGADALPASGMDLAQARAFAGWRLGRLPTSDEWRRVTAGGGNSPFPWGVKQFATHANTGDLGLGEAMPVGTFESGRRAGGDMPYDLIGNVREWTETVPLEWLELGASLGPRSFSDARDRALRSQALSQWCVLGLLPMGAIVGAGGQGVPRKVVGADFATPMRAVVDEQDDTQAAGARSQRTGLRVYATVDELLARLLAIEDRPSAEESLQLKRFVRRNGHGPILKAAFDASPTAGAVFASESVGSLLAAELRAVGAEPR